MKTLKKILVMCMTLVVMVGVTGCVDSDKQERLIQFINVDLPAPFGPISVRTFPGLTCSEIWLSRGFLPYPAATSSSLIPDSFFLCSITRSSVTCPHSCAASSQSLPAPEIRLSPN